MKADDTLLYIIYDVMGYSYPPQYAVKEDVKENINEDDINDIEPYVHTYEEDYSKSGESASGYIKRNSTMTSMRKANISLRSFKK
ncbi:hypothetical protein P5V15_004377 [Pogonomyrmex californicus]